MVFLSIFGVFFSTLYLPLSVFLTLSPPPENQRHQDQNLSKGEFWMLRENPRFFFFFFWQNPSLLYFQSQYTNELEKSKAWRNKNQLKYLTLNIFSPLVITCWVFNSPNQQEIYNKLCGQTITKNNRKKNDKTKLKKFKTRMEIEV